VNSAAPSLAEKVVLLAHALETAAIPFAFGGALALAYYAEPRATVDIDVNVFVPPADFDRIRDVCAPLGIGASPSDRRAAQRDDQVRLWWASTPVDLFFAYDAFHFHAATRIRKVPFGDETIDVLAAEDLIVCKVVFDRRKDWIDIEQVLLLTAGDIDLDDVRHWIEVIIGNDDPRSARFEAAVRDVLGDQSA
jgi:hypothetical protein